MPTLKEQQAQNLEQYIKLLTPSEQKKATKITEQKQTKPTFFQKIISALTTGETGEAAYYTLQGKNPIEEYGKSIGKSISGYGYDKKTYADVLEKLGMKKTYLSEKLPFLYSETGKGLALKKGGFLDPSDTGALGLTLDILGDPTTYLGGAGLFKRIGKAGKGLTTAGKAVKEGIEKETMNFIKKQGLENTDKAISLIDKANEKIVGILNKTPDKYFKGLTFMGQEIVPRKYALTPGRYADKLMSHIPVMNVPYTGIKNGIQDMFKVGADIIRKGKSLGSFGEESANIYLKGKDNVSKSINYFSSDLFNDLNANLKLLKKASNKNEREAVFKYVTDKIQTGLGDLGVNNIDKNLVDNLIIKFENFNKGFYGQEKNAYKRLGEDMYKEISGYMPSRITEEGKKALAWLKANKFQSRGYKSFSTASEKHINWFKFVDENGGIHISTPEALGVKKVEPMKGMWHNLSYGEYKSIADISKELKKWGFDLEFKKQPTVHKTALGYFDPVRKKIVIASAQPTVDDVLSTLRHEITHNVHFQFAGLTDMIETFKGGKNYKKYKGILETAKTSVREEWPKILEIVRGIDEEAFKKLTPYFKTYYRKPTELMSFASQALEKNPLAKDLIPKTAKSLEELNKAFNFFDFNKFKVLGGEPEVFGKYIDEAGKVFKVDRVASISEKNKELADLMTKAGFKDKNFFLTDPFEMVYGRGYESAKKVSYLNFYADLAEQIGKDGAITKKYFKDNLTGKTTILKTTDSFVDPQTGIRFVDPKIKGFPEGKFLPDFIVSDLKKSWEMVNDEKVTNQILKLYDNVLNKWKGMVYGWWPASHGRNFIGGSFSNFLANPKWAGYIPKFEEIWKGKNGVIDLPKYGKVSYETVRQRILKSGILQQTGALDIDQLRKTFNPSAYSKIEQVPRKAMEFVENTLRGPLYLAELMDGKTFDEAAKTVFKYHFDYAPEALTAFEKSVMRRMIPFYRWTRGNIPLMIEETIAQPGKMTATFKMMRNATDSEGKLHQEWLPSYIEKEGYIQKGGQTLSMFGLPPIEALKYLRNPINEFESGVTPFIKIPIELRANYSFFKDKQISEDTSGNFAEHYPKIIKNWLEYEEETITPKDGKSWKKMTVNPLKKYWLYGLPSGRLAGILSSTLGENEKNKILSTLGGIKTYQFDMENLKNSVESKYEKDLLELFYESGLFGEFKYPYAGTKEKLK